MKTVREVSRITGVSVRALHHYDTIGLLKPSGVTPAGYRLYDDEALRRLQMILLFRELDVPLGEIRRLLDDPAFDRRAALERQLALLRARRERIDGLIALVCELRAEDGAEPELAALAPGHQEPDPPEAPAHGAVQACAAHGCADGDAALLAQFAALGRLRPLPPGDAAVQRQVERLRCYISSNYFSCTLDVFESLGGLYASDAFSGTIDGAGGAGTAAFIAAAISAYCRTAARRA